MYYHLINTDAGVEIYETKLGWYVVNRELMIKTIGTFGRKDYAKHWCDYKNCLLTEKEHKEFLFN